MNRPLVMSYHFSVSKYYSIITSPGAIGECDILVVATTTDSMMLEWGTCPGATVYYLDLVPVPAGFIQRQILSSQPREATLAGLLPGTKYTVLLRISTSDEPVSTATSYTGIPASLQRLHSTYFFFCFLQTGV